MYTGIHKHIYVYESGILSHINLKEHAYDLYKQNLSQALPDQLLRLI